MEAYLLHRLKQAGLERPCFDAIAVEMIASASDGVPRTINLLARTAWIEASQKKENTIFPPYSNFPASSCTYFPFQANNKHPSESRLISALRTAQLIVGL